MNQKIISLNYFKNKKSRIKKQEQKNNNKKKNVKKIIKK